METWPSPKRANVRYAAVTKIIHCLRFFDDYEFK
jgi:hypothetical protein